MHAIVYWMLLKAESGGQRLQNQEVSHAPRAPLASSHLGRLHGLEPLSCLYSFFHSFHLRYVDRVGVQEGWKDGFLEYYIILTAYYHPINAHLPNHGKTLNLSSVITFDKIPFLMNQEQLSIFAFSP